MARYISLRHGPPLEPIAFLQVAAVYLDVEGLDPHLAAGQLDKKTVSFGSDFPAQHLATAQQQQTLLGSGLQRRLCLRTADHQKGEPNPQGKLSGEEKHRAAP